MKTIFDAIQIGDLELPNRIFMAPLTRSRSLKPEHTQTPLHALYYSQRASAGLIISEATQIRLRGQGYAWTPGTFTDARVESWRLITDAVHNVGGHMFNQLWHVGVISHNIFRPERNAPVYFYGRTAKGYTDYQTIRKTKDEMKNAR